MSLRQDQHHSMPPVSFGTADAGVARRTVFVGSSTSLLGGAAGPTDYAMVGSCFVGTEKVHRPLFPVSVREAMALVGEDDRESVLMACRSLLRNFSNGPLLLAEEFRTEVEEAYVRGAAQHRPTTQELRSRGPGALGQLIGDVRTLESESGAISL